MQQQSSLSKIKTLMGLFYLFYFALIGVYIIFLPKVLKDLGFTGFEVGVIFSIAPMMRFILPFIFREFGGLNSITYKISLILMPLSAWFFFVGLENFFALIVINMFYGASMGTVLPFIDTIALKTITKKNYGKVRLWGSIGFMVIALWLGKFLDSNIEVIYYLFGLSFALSLSGFSIVNFDKDSQSSQKSVKKGLSLSKYWAWWLGTLLFQISFGGFYNFFTIYETTNGISLEITSWLWSFGVVCEIVMLYFQGRLLERFNLLSLIEISIFSGAVRWLLLWLYPNSLSIAFLSQSLHSLNFALYYTASIAYVYKIYTHKRLAQQFFLGISFGLGGSVGAFVAGVIYERDSTTLFLSQALIALSALFAILIHRRRVYGR